VYRYSSDAARHSCASDDLNNTSSTLRQEAISITRVRCKRRKTWIRSPTRSPNNTTKPSSYLQQRRLKSTLTQPFSPNHQGENIEIEYVFSWLNLNLEMSTITRSLPDNRTHSNIYIYILSLCLYACMYVCLILFLRA
jgi:hypothetical protein